MLKRGQTGNGDDDMGGGGTGAGGRFVGVRIPDTDGWDSARMPAIRAAS